MYALVNEISLRWVLARETAPFAISLVIAETFFKFHSFTLETLAFLLTWYLVSRGLSSLAAGLRRG